jgi:hypothetical protein
MRCWRWHHWLCILNKVVNKNRPRTFLVIIGHIVINHHCKIQQQIPCILWNRSFMMFLWETRRCTYDIKRMSMMYLILIPCRLWNSLPIQLKITLLCCSYRFMWQLICFIFKCWCFLGSFWDLRINFHAFFAQSA